MRHRLRPCPVRVVLVPGDDAAVPRRLAKQLIVPEPRGPSSNCDAGTVKAGFQSRS